MQSHKMIASTDEPGDCLRACIACLMDMEPGDVPHFASDREENGDQIWQRVREWLKPQGLTLWFTAYDGNATLDEVLSSVASVNPEMYYMVAGWGGYDDHIVIALNDRIVHDPARMGAGLTRAGSNGFWLVVTLASARMVAS